MLTVLVATLSALTQAPSSQARSSALPTEQLLEAARAQLGIRNLDSAAVLLRLVGEAPERAVSDRVQAWVLLGIVDFYRAGEPAAASAFRSALALDPLLEVEDLESYDPAIKRLLDAERVARPGDTAVAVEAPQPSAVPDATPAADSLYACVAKCPDGVVPPHFTFFPRLDVTDASVGVYERRLRTFLTFHAVISASGIIEQETLVVVGGTARRTEAELRGGLAQARFAPGRAQGTPVRTRVALRFDFEAEGSGVVRYSYRVVAR